MSLKKNLIIVLAMALMGMTFIAVPANAFQFGSFADVRFTDSSADDAKTAFALGAFDLYASQQIDEKTNAFVEYVFEHNGTEFVLDLERLYIKRSISEALEIGAGRFHSPLGYWNSTYHHGVLMQDTVERPFFLRFEDDGGVLPVHIIGLWAEGKINRNFSYEAGVANSSFLDSTVTGQELGVGNVSDFTDKKSFIGRLAYTASHRPLSVGVFAMQNNIAESNTAGLGLVALGENLVTQTIAGADFRFARGPFDVMSEYYNLTNDDKTPGGDSQNAAAFFVQLGFQVTDTNKIVYRYDSLTFDAADLYFQLLDVSEAVHHTVALRHNFSDSNALTLEVERTDFDDSALDDETATTLDWAFMMF